MRFLALLSVIAVLAGCSDFDNFYESKVTGKREKRAGPEVIAVVGSDEITMNDLLRALERLPYTQRKIYQSSPQRMNEFLDSYINQKVLYSEAVKMGTDKRKDVLEKTENFKKKLVGQTFGQEILKSMKVSQEEIQSYYLKHKNDYEEIAVSEIFIKAEPEKGITKEGARAEAEAVSERAKAGESWEKLVEEYSDDPVSKKKGGNAGYIQRGRFGPETDDRLFEMKKGEITNPLEVDGGYFIIKIDEGVRLLPAGQVSRKIESRIINEKLIEYVKGLREEWGVEVYRDRLEESVKSDQ